MFGGVSVKYTKLRERMDALHALGVNPVFGGTVAAIQDGKEMFLYLIEEQSVQQLKVSDTDEQSRGQVQDLSFVKRLLAESKQEVD